MNKESEYVYILGDGVPLKVKKIHIDEVPTIYRQNYTLHPNYWEAWAELCYIKEHHLEPSHPFRWKRDGNHEFK